MPVPNSPESNRIQQLRMELIARAQHLELTLQQRNERSITPEFIHKTHFIAADLTDEIERSSLSYEEDLSEIIENLTRIRRICNAILAHYENNDFVDYFSLILESLRPQMILFRRMQDLLNSL